MPVAVDQVEITTTLAQQAVQVELVVVAQVVLVMLRELMAL